MAERFNSCEAILSHAARLADRTAIISYAADGTEHETSYRALAKLVDRSAHALINLGLKPGDRIGLMLHDSPLFCAAFLGVIKAGGVAIALNPRLAPADYSFIREDSQAKFIVLEPEFLSLFDDARNLVTRDAFSERMASSADSFSAAPTERDDPAFWLYSSGTTGRPKAVIHSQFNCAHSGKMLREAIGASEHTKVFATSKLFFAFALDNSFLGPLGLGATTIINAAWPEPEAVVAQVARHRPDIFFTVPSFFRRLLALGPDKLAPFRAVKYFYTGGERLPDAMAEQWLDAVGVELHACYGSTETHCNVFANFPERNRQGSCGQPLAGVEMKLMDRDNAPIASGEPGVLWIKHPTLALGYKNLEATAKAFDDGWFCTNDMFTVDAEGYWWHQGRADELMKVAGQWVKPMEVEEAVLGAGAVREAACVIVFDRDGFERLALFVVPDSNATGAARVFAEEQAARALPRHSQPKWVREIAELPRTPTGKVQRFKLRQVLEAEWEKSSTDN